MQHVHIALSVHVDGEEWVWEHGDWSSDDPRSRVAEVLRQAAVNVEHRP